MKSEKEKEEKEPLRGAGMLEKLLRSRAGGEEAGERRKASVAVEAVMTMEGEGKGPRSCA